MITSYMQHIRVPDNQTVEVHSHEKDRRKLHFHLYYLKTMLPNVVVRVRLLEFFSFLSF